MAEQAILSARDLDFFYGAAQALRHITLDIPAGRVTALIGPSGCGKSTFLRTINRMNDLVPGTRMAGSLTFQGQEIYAPGLDVTALRRRVGMVFQKPNPFPMSIYDNVAYGPRTHGERRRARLDELVETSLRAAAIWEEYRDHLTDALANLRTNFDCDIVLGGALSPYLEELLPEICWDLGEKTLFEGDSFFLRLDHFGPHSACAGTALRFIDDFLLTF